MATTERGPLPQYSIAAQYETPISAGKAFDMASTGANAWSGGDLTAFSLKLSPGQYLVAVVGKQPAPNLDSYLRNSLTSNRGRLTNLDPQQLRRLETERLHIQVLKEARRIRQSNKLLL